MHATTVAVDLAKSIFQIAIADDNWHAVERQCLTRSRFKRWFQNHDVGLVVMETCGSAHHWGRRLSQRGIPVKLLPAACLRAYVKRNKTDAAEACTLQRLGRCCENFANWHWIFPEYHATVFLMLLTKTLNPSGHF